MADAFADLRKGLFAQMQQNQMQAFQKQLSDLGGRKEDPAQGQPQQIGQPQPQADVWPELTGGQSSQAAQHAMGGGQAPEMMHAHQLAQVQQQAQAMAQIPQAAASSQGGAQTSFFDWAQVGALAGAQQKLKEEEELERTKSHKYKLAMCEFWQSKRCRKGDNCTWAHGEHELRPADDAGGAGWVNGLPPAGSSAAGQADMDSNTCWYYNRGWCTRGAQCKFHHDPAKVIQHPKLGKETCGPAQTTQQQADAVTLLYQQALMQQLQSDPNAYAAALAQAAAGSGGYDEATLAAIAQWQQALAAQAAGQ